MASRPFDLPGNPSPALHDVIAQGKHAPSESLSQRVAGGRVARAISVIVWEVMDSLVVFGERENADMEALLVLLYAQAFTKGAPCGLTRAATTLVSSSDIPAAISLALKIEIAEMQALYELDERHSGLARNQTLELFDAHHHDSIMAALGHALRPLLVGMPTTSLKRAFASSSFQRRAAMRLPVLFAFVSSTCFPIVPHLVS